MYSITLKGKKLLEGYDEKYKIDLDHERIWKRKEEEAEWSILVPELDKANRDLGDN